MNAARHTPGPWMVSGTTVYALMVDGWCNGKEVQCNRFYAHVYTDRRAHEGEAEANACLIAESPNLLAALTQLSFMARTSGTPTPELLRACEGAEALIAKTGGAL